MSSDQRQRTDGSGTRCSARSKRSGEQCMNWAVTGAAVCRMHGAGTPQAKRKAAERLAQMEQARTVELWGGRLDVNPAEALLELVQTKAAEVAYWRYRTSLLVDAESGLPLWGVTKTKTGGDDYGTTEEAKPPVEYVMLQAAERDLASYSAAALRAGVEQVMVQVAQVQAGQVLDLLNRVLDLAASDPGLSRPALIAAALSLDV